MNTVYLNVSRLDSPAIHTSSSWSPWIAGAGCRCFMWSRASDFVFTTRRTCRICGLIRRPPHLAVPPERHKEGQRESKIELTVGWTRILLELAA